MLLTRSMDIFLSIILLVAACPFFLLITLALWFQCGSPFFIQQRLGKDKVLFKLIKFRTMAISTPSVPSHFIATNSVTKTGRLLRRLKLDELPQLFNVLNGDMSLVGPRPGLACQEELTAARDALGVYSVLPGITGLAQIKGVDMSRPLDVARLDKHLVDSFSFQLYLSVLFKTAAGHGRGDALKR